MAQSVERQSSAQVMISRFVSSSPSSGSVLIAQSLELLQILCLPLFPSPTYSLSLSLSLSLSHTHSKINFFFLKKEERLGVPAEGSPVGGQRQKQVVAVVVASGLVGTHAEPRA